MGGPRQELEDVGGALRLLLSLALIGCLACATWRPEELPAAVRSLEVRAEIEGVPFHAQREEHCGPAALATVLGWSGEAVTPELLSTQVQTWGRRGSLQSEMLSAARRRGRLAYPVGTLADLLVELAAGHPVLVLQNLGLSWFPRWHYAVAFGYDLERGTLLLRSGESPRRRMHLPTFVHTWRRSGNFAVVALEPGRLPASAREDVYLEATLGLERARRWPEATRAYAAALERWGEGLAALIGLANAHHASGDLMGAESALRRATRAFPEAGVAFNNLAQVLLELGRQPEAVAAATRAVGIGGVHLGQYRETLEEVTRRGR